VQNSHVADAFCTSFFSAAIRIILCSIFYHTKINWSGHENTRAQSCDFPCTNSSLAGTVKPCYTRTPLTGKLAITDGLRRFWNNRARFCWLYRTNSKPDRTMTLKNKNIVYIHRKLISRTGRSIQGRGSQSPEVLK